MKKMIALCLAALLLVGCSERDLGGGKAKNEPEAKSASSAPVESSKPEKEEKEPEPKENKSLKLAKSYAELLASGRYYIDCTAVIEYEGMMMENPMLIAVDGENSSISVSSDLTGALVTIRTLTYDGAVYMVNDEQRSYMEIDEAQAASSFNTEFDELEHIGEGEGEFCGEEHEYIEFACGEDSVKLFFENDKLIGMTRSIEDSDVSQTALKINGISQNIPDKLIAMPIGYTKQ